ncbi:MAG: hypothetical protein ACK2U9_12835, partial [Anaerolineae bacterium]
FPTGTTTDLSFQVDLSNVASRGTSADRIVVKLWDGAPEAGGTLVQTETVLRGPGAGPRTLSFEWHGVQPGPHDVIIEVQRVAGESNISNNRIQHPVFIPRGDFFRFLPAVPAN